MSLSVTFQCRSCGEAAREPPRHAGGIVGPAQSVRWLAGPPDAKADPPASLGAAPAVGDLHWLAVRFPFLAGADRPFWSLYQPPATVFDGWNEFPEEIAASALVECSLVDVADRTGSNAKILVRVTEVISVPDVASALLPIKQTTSLIEQYDNGRSWLSRSDRYTHLSFNFESDAGAWMVVERRDEEHFAILNGDWDFHTDWFVAANRRLTATDVALLARLAAERGLV